MPIDFTLTIPNTLTDAIDRIVNGLDDRERREIHKSGADMFHHGIGTAIRNNWGLWTWSTLKQHFIDTHKIGHADDMSGLILAGVTAKVRGEPHDIAKQVEYYHDYWRRKGIDACTLEHLRPGEGMAQQEIEDDGFITVDTKKL